MQRMYCNAIDPHRTVTLSYSKCTYDRNTAPAYVVLVEFAINIMTPSHITHAPLFHLLRGQFPRMKAEVQTRAMKCSENKEAPLSHAPIVYWL